MKYEEWIMEKDLLFNFTTQLNHYWITLLGFQIIDDIKIDTDSIFFFFFSLKWFLKILKTVNQDQVLKKLRIMYLTMEFLEIASGRMLSSSIILSLCELFML